MDDAVHPKKGLKNLLLILVILAVAGFAALWMRLSANQRNYGQQVNDVLDTRMQNLENSIVQHEKRLKDLEDMTQKLAAAPQPVQTSVPAAVSVSSAATDDRIAALEKEIASMKAASPLQDNAAVSRSIRALSSFYRLSEKVLAGKPFGTELTAFEEVAGSNEAAGAPLATLAPYADSGIPTFATLLVTFDQAVEGLNAAEAVPPADAGIWQRFKYNVKHLVTIRRIDDAQSGSSANAIVGRAQAHLEREEIEAAVSEIKSLPENLRSNFAAWLDDAQTVTEAPSLIDQLQEEVMQKAFAPPASVPTSASTPAAQPAPPQPVAPQNPPAEPEPDNSSSPRT